MPDSFEVKLRVPLAVFLGVAAAALSVLYVVKGTWANALIFIGATIAGAATVFSAYYAATGVHEQTKQQMLQNTFWLLRELDDLSFLEVRNQLDNLLRDGDAMTPTNLVAAIHGDNRLYAGTRGLLNTLEDVSVGIQSGYVDEEVAQQSIGVLLLFTTSRLGPFIQAHRKLVSSDEVYCELLKLQAAWRDKKYLSTGERFDA